MATPEPPRRAIDGHGFARIAGLLSYSKYLRALDPWYEENYPEFPPMRTVVKEILQTEDDLTEIVQLVGKDSLAESDKLILEVAKIIRDDYLAQNGFSDFDKTCPFFKAVWMMKNIVDFYNQAKKAIVRVAGLEPASVDLRVHSVDCVPSLRRVVR